MRDMRVRIVGATVAVTQVHLEMVGHVPGLKEGAAARKICDYALLAESGDGIQAILIELKSTRSDEEEPREQLRRSLPVLDSLRSACDVERGTGTTRRMSVGYALVFERENARTLRKQRVRGAAPATERYRDITVRTFVGNAVPFPSLMPAVTSA
ncbi:MAG: hypothetical protein J4F37_01440 [Acidobacteria bacterium]|nr:hypothetical protein [Acidobacteriota bacterium]